MFQPDLLRNKRVLITGGGTGLGKGTAQRFLELGAEVYICGRREEVLSATAQERKPWGAFHSRFSPEPPVRERYLLCDPAWQPTKTYAGCLIYVTHIDCIGSL